jgi:O-antigen ligase
MNEPGTFCVAMMPAFFVSLNSFFKGGFRFLKKWKCIIIIISVFFSLSLSGYVGIVLSFILLFYNYKKFRYILIGVILICAFVYYAYNYIGDIQDRVNWMQDVLYKKTLLDLTPDISTFSFLTNALVTYNTFMESPVLGVGLGSYELSYYKYIGKIVDVDKVISFFNWNDANSLFLRLLSETGLFGVLLFFWFIFRFYVFKKNDRSGYLWLINNGILVAFLIRLIRFGHYFIVGFFFFFWIYYFAGKASRMLKKVQDENPLSPRGYGPSFEVQK